MNGATLTLIDHSSEIPAFKRWLGERRDILAVDTETGGFDWWRDELRMVQFGDTQQGWAIPTELWRGLALEVLNEYDGPLVLQNSKFDAHFLGNEGIKLPWHRTDDTMLMAHLIDPTRPIGLKECADRYLGANCSTLEAQLRVAFQKGGWSWPTIPFSVPAYWQYAALDTVLTARLYEYYKPHVAAYTEPYNLERAVQHVLYKMERRGVRIDLDYIARTREEWTAQIAALETEMLMRWGVENPNATAQVYRALQAEGVELVKRTPTGKPSLTDDVMKELTHPLAKQVVEHRRLVKWRTAYLDSFAELADGDLLHCSMRQLGARTSRMSITRPALQTMPRNRRIRDAVIPRDGNALLLADYDGIELRLLTHYASIPSLREAYLAGVDVHTYVGQRAYRVQEITKRQRQLAKNGSYAKIYGAGISTFARTMGIPLDEAETFMASYDREFPEVRQFQEQVARVGTERLYKDGQPWVRTFYGRRMPSDPDKIYTLINYLIQGTAAEVLKRALVELDSCGLGDYMVLPVHDEIDFDVPAAEAEALQHEVADVMRNDDFSVPLTVHTSLAHARWGDAYPDEDS